METLLAGYPAGVSLAKDKPGKPDTSKLRQVFRAVMEWLHAAGAFRVRDLETPVVRQLISETASIFNDAVDAEVKTVPPSDVLVRTLKRSGYVFSGFKSYNMIRQAEGLLVDEKGQVKPFNRFLRDVKKLDDTYNERYLYTEYKFAVASARMADKWKEFEKDKDDYNLQYRTANDERVRETHKELHGITLPFSSPFWDKYFPPNGWGCRCTVVQVRENKYPVSDLEDAMKKGEEATDGKFQKMFRFNPGKSGQLFPPHNPYTTSRCAGCDVAMSLAKIPDNELCRACPFIREMAEKKYKNKYKPFGQMVDELQDNRQNRGFFSVVATSNAFSEKTGHEYAIVTERELLHATRDSKVDAGKSIPLTELFERLEDDFANADNVYKDTEDPGFIAVVNYNDNEYLKYVFKEQKRIKGISEKEKEKLLLVTIGIVEKFNLESGTRYKKIK